LVGSVASLLPNGCPPLEDRPLDTADPATLFGTNSEINQKAPPHRVGSLRSKRPLPTGHFATNEIRPTPIPMRLFPYEGK